MRVLVTGGCGFIGSHIVDALIDNNHTVAVADNLTTGNIENLNSEALFYETDILNSDFMNVLKDFSPDAVFHQAAQIDIQKSIKDSSFDAMTNVVGTVRVLENCRDYNVSKIIYASSAAVYGTPEYLPVDEQHRISPMSFYGISKYTPELYIRTFSDLYGLKYTILRYANVYGIRQEPKGEGGVVSVFTNKLINGETPVVFGDGEQTRDFIYVKDIAAANLSALTRGDNSVINVSTGVKTSVNKLLEIMSDGTAKAEYRDARKGDILHSYLDNSKMKSILKCDIKYPLEVGVRETLDYYKSVNNK